MSKENIAVLNDEDLARVCGGVIKKAAESDGQKAIGIDCQNGCAPYIQKGLATELGRQTFLAIAAPVVITASVGASLLTKWVVDKLTKRLDQKLNVK